MQLRDYLPKTLFGRMLSIILLPMILVQVITVFIFYERHWDTVTRHMAQHLAGEMALVIDQAGTAPDAATIEAITATGWEYFSFPVNFDKGASLGVPVPVPSAAAAMPTALSPISMIASTTALTSW